MKPLSSILFATLFFLIPNSYAQKNCQFKIDTAKILANQNLDEFIWKFQSDSFVITNNKKDIPSFIKKQLDCYTDKFSIANPKESYQIGCVVVKNLPKRQLAFLAKSKDVLVISYIKGGAAMTRHFLFIKFNNNEITDLWCGVCLNDIDSKEEILDYIKEHKSKPEGLNTNSIYL